MTVRRSLVALILLYVTLDLSLASMPGAFVFEAGESVESVQLGRGRQVADIETAVASPREGERAVIENADIRPRLLPRPLRRRPRRVGHRSSARTPVPPPLSDDSD